ncbi:zinc-dependent alcohol dehydrogenase family protein [Arenibacter algicola]|uniref:Putative alcohol dehydrogenase AdhA n=1 Tax=Arenibacter algicola TaxID=616991 RepID=A0A221UYB6_9FLAO|nr:zinc-dependent alcohol dehydrogenase family protein [Arenibacter algicola]ASO06345.1 putative alcohol dehydrogenase AdhA [Arenibacter algicola]|tara:strand:- start:184 stop:1212 length:1029 start_codon:yes stop_codon:yes gene_type:complete
MKAMILNGVSNLKENRNPLTMVNIPVPVPKDMEVLIKILVCGVCHTELDEIEGRIAPIVFPVVPGHQVVGIVTELGTGTSKFKIGDRVGVAWIYSACGLCKFCLDGKENLCDHFLATGKDVNGGYAEYMAVPEKYAHKIPEFFSDAEAAPLLCAGAIGYRSLRLAQLKDGDNVGLTGFGASAHLVLKILKYSYPKTKIFVFARKEEERTFAKELGAEWAGDTSNACPEKLDVIIDTTPAWKPVVEALANLKKGGRLVINAIRKEGTDKGYLQNLNYQDHLWMEKEIKSVANLTAKDVEDFLILAANASIRPEVQIFSLEEANKALFELKERHVKGAKVLKIN